MSDWTTLADRLAEVLGELSATARVIITEPKPPFTRRFVQFARHDDVLAAQLVSNHSLESEWQADVAGWRAITRAGWHEPDIDNANLWWVDFDAPVTVDDCRRAAAIAVTGLRDGYGITAPTELVYSAWLERPGHPHLELSTLGLPRQPLP